MTTTPTKKSQPYEEAIQAAMKFLAESESDSLRNTYTPTLAVQVAQVHAQLAIAAAIRAIWMDCDCK